MSWRVKVRRGLMVALVCQPIVSAPPLLAQTDSVTNPFADDGIGEETLPPPRADDDGFAPLIDPALSADEPFDAGAFSGEPLDGGALDSRALDSSALDGSTLNRNALDNGGVDSRSADDVFARPPARTRSEPTPALYGEDSTPPARLDGPGVDDQDAEILPTEIVRERYPDGSIKIERGVTQDENQNYINHGPWSMRDRQGSLVAEGSYRFGQRHGKWRRLYETDEAPLFSQPPFNQFEGPFLSEAEFENGELNGRWTIHAANGTLVSDWNFVAGRRDGQSIWYYHNREKMRVIEYQAGQLQGRLVEFDVQGNTVTDVKYLQGRRLEKTTEKFPSGDARIEGMVLRKMLTMKQPDDWWEAKLATYSSDGKDEKHGDWKSWYASGQQKFTGTYQFDEPDGEFTWWHENGQKSLSGFYEQGRKQGPWTWWHASGIKSIQGNYQFGSPVGRWIWWREDGKVAQRIDFSSDASSSLPSPPMDTRETQSILLQQPQN